MERMAGRSPRDTRQRKLTLRCQNFLHGGETRLYFARSGDGTKRRGGLPSAAFFLRRTSSRDEVHRCQRSERVGARMARLELVAAIKEAKAPALALRRGPSRFLF